MAFSYYCLVPYQFGLSDTLLNKIKRVTKSCLSLNTSVVEVSLEGINDVNFDKKLFELAGRVVEYIYQTGNHFLVAVSKPREIEKKEEDRTGHALYVALKYLENDTYQVIITNGGEGVTQFHQCSEEMNKKDREKYYYAAFKPFSIKSKEIRDGLRHYVYTLIVMGYKECAIKDPEERKFRMPGHDTYENLMANVYLRDYKEASQECFFYGFGGKKITSFEREDLDIGFSMQITGNCTVHNYKKALMVLYDMDELTFGLFEDTLLHGLDEMISEVLAKQPRVFATSGPSEFFAASASVCEAVPVPAVDHEKEDPNDQIAEVHGTLEGK